MIRPFSIFLVSGLLLLSLPVPVTAGLMDRACLRSERKDTSRPMCRCIQQVANQALSVKDQRVAATFFKDPGRSQVIRQSDNIAHEKFWVRYKEFGNVVAASCGHLRR